VRWQKGGSAGMLPAQAHRRPGMPAAVGGRRDSCLHLGRISADRSANNNDLLSDDPHAENKIALGSLVKKAMIADEKDLDSPPAPGYN